MEWVDLQAEFFFVLNLALTLWHNMTIIIIIVIEEYLYFNHNTILIAHLYNWQPCCYFNFQVLPAKFHNTNFLSVFAF